MSPGMQHGVSPCTEQAPAASSESGSRSARSTRTSATFTTSILEVLAELGWVGLLILGAALVVPLTAVARARSRPLMPAAAGVYVAYLAHASVDWDWQVPGPDHSRTGRRRRHDRGRTGSPSPADHARRAYRRSFCVVAPLVAVAVAIHAGQWRLEEARRSLERGNFVPAANEAVAAERWLPWAAEPWLVRGEALLASDDVIGARNALRHASRMDSGKLGGLVRPHARRARRRARGRARAGEAAQSAQPRGRDSCRILKLETFLYIFLTGIAHAKGCHASSRSVELIRQLVEGGDPSA